MITQYHPLNRKIKWRIEKYKILLDNQQTKKKLTKSQLKYPIL